LAAVRGLDWGVLEDLFSARRGHRSEDCVFLHTFLDLGSHILDSLRKILPVYGLCRDVVQGAGSLYIVASVFSVSVP
jgi:hypothetical protein